MSSEGGISTLDAATINMQRMVSVVTHRHIRLDQNEKQLEKTLTELAEFWSHETEEKDNVPYQFQLKNQAEFKRFSIPISRSMWAVRKIVTHWRTELYKYEIGLTPDVPSIPIAAPAESEPTTKVEVNTAKKPAGSGLTDKLKNLTKSFKHDSFSPLSVLNDSIEYTQKIEIKWHTILHWYGLATRKRSNRINTKQALIDLLDNIIIVFDFYVEPNLVMAVHYAHELIKQDIEELAKQSITSYLQAHERSRNRPPPPPPQG